jgi:hypothetical protein
VPPPVKLADDDEDEIDAGYVSNDAPLKRQKLGQDDGIEQSSRQLDVGNYFSLKLYANSLYFISIKFRILVRIIQ